MTGHDGRKLSPIERANEWLREPPLRPPEPVPPQLRRPMLVAEDGQFVGAVEFTVWVAERDHNAVKGLGQRIIFRKVWER